MLAKDQLIPGGFLYFKLSCFLESNVIISSENKIDAN